MHTELLPGTTNVIRFPVERRASPTLDLLRGIAPDPREMMALAESFGLPQPDPRARHDEDEGTAEFIANHVVPEPGPARRKALDEMLAEALGAAVAACQAAHDAAVVADTARQVRAATGYRRSSSGLTIARWQQQPCCWKRTSSASGPRAPRGRSASRAAVRPGGRSTFRRKRPPSSD